LYRRRSRIIVRVTIPCILKDLPDRPLNVISLPAFPALPELNSILPRPASLSAPELFSLRDVFAVAFAK
jgi:hypothetical protein